MSFNEILDTKLDALRGLGQPDDVVTRFGAALRGAGDWDLFHVNPLRFAATHGLPLDAAVDVFVASARIGLFDFDWNLICHMCGGIQRTHGSIDGLGDARFYCAPCETQVDGALDEQVEVSFTVNPAVRDLDVDCFADRASYQRSFFSASHEWPAEMVAYVEAGFVDFIALEPNGFTRREIDVEAGRSYHVVSFDSHAACWIRGDGASPEKILDVELLGDRFASTEYHSAPGRVQLQIHNRQARRAGVIVVRMEMREILDILQRSPHVVHPFLSGKMLLNHQGFRELFRVQSTTQSLHLNVRSLTLLFTDLRSSTALYDRVGDVQAYRLIQEHFKILTRAVRDHSGAIVKTMGDAIMATFSSPRDGVLAALDMARDFEALSLEVPDLGLKVGLHEGPALVINADDRLDYFGQTVNIAARVQGLAGAGEMVATDVVLAGWGVEEALRGHADLLERAEVPLRGVAQKVGVQRFAIRMREPAHLAD